MLSALLLIVLALLLFYRYLRQHYQIFVEDGIPGPPPKLLIGNLAEFAVNRKDSLATFVSLTEKYGKVFGYYEGLTPSIVVSDPSLMEQIMIKHFHQFDGRPNCWPFQHGPEHLALHNLNGPCWKRHRDVIASAFRTSNIRKMWPRLLAAVSLYVERLEQQRKEQPHGFNIAGENESYSMEACTSAVFDVDPRCLSREEKHVIQSYMRSTHQSGSPENPATGLSRVYPFLAPILKLFDTEHKHCTMQYQELVSHRLQDEQAKLSQSSTPSNLLQHLLAVRDDHGDQATTAANTPVTLHQVEGMVAGLFGGGLGPAVAALDFSLHCLAMYPEQQDKLRREVLAVLGSQQEPPSMDQVQSMEYLDMFVSETLRHYPVAPGVARTVSEDCVVRGVQFRKGTSVRLMSFVQYRDPNVYPDPSVFRPERFSKAEREQRHPYSFMPFGNGPRMCVGKRLGLLQVKLGLVTLLRRFRVCCCDQTQSPLPVAFRPFLGPRNGVFVKLELLD